MSVPQVSHHFSLVQLWELGDVWPAEPRWCFMVVHYSLCDCLNGLVQLGERSEHCSWWASGLSSQCSHRHGFFKCSQKFLCFWKPHLKKVSQLQSLQNQWLMRLPSDEKTKSRMWFKKWARLLKRKKIWVRQLPLHFPIEIRPIGSSSDVKINHFVWTERHKSQIYFIIKYNNKHFNIGWSSFSWIYIVSLGLFKGTTKILEP